MTWTTPADLRAQVQRLWDKGEILTSLATGEPLFPRRLVLKAPSSSEISERFGEVRAWIAELRALPPLRVEMRAFNHRLLGSNAIPAEVWLDSIGDALALVGKGRDAARFTELVEMTRRQQPAILPWLAKRPLRGLELRQDWSRLLGIVSWLLVHPRPGVYLRQVDIPGVHTKFIEAYRGVLGELLDLLLPPMAIESSATGAGQFARRYGFRDRPERIRFRMLDPAQALLPHGVGRDITLDSESFVRLDVAVSKVFITENEINFLALPALPESLAIFGSGYGFEALGRAAWLKRCTIHYWGDLDSHGFAILDQLRGQFEHVESFLMDRATLTAFESQWGEEAKPTCRDLPRLRPEEQAVYDELRDNRLGKNLHLEQEKIGFGWVEAALATL